MNTNFVLFNIEGGTYGIDINNIVSIEKVSKTTHTPQMPDYMVGIVSIRGQVLPIIDSKKLLYNQASQIDQNTRYILIETEHTTIAFMVESTNEIINFDPSLIKPVSLVGSSSSQSFLDGVALVEDRIISIINIQELISSLDNIEKIKTDFLTEV
jgi:purine-binding chemotaxis protein CheW